MSQPPIGLEHVADAVRATLELFVADAPELEGREVEIDPVPGGAGEIIATIDGERFCIAIRAAGDAE